MKTYNNVAYVRSFDVRALGIFVLFAFLLIHAGCERNDPSRLLGVGGRDVSSTTSSGGGGGEGNISSNSVVATSGGASTGGGDTGGSGGGMGPVPVEPNGTSLFLEVLDASGTPVPSAAVTVAGVQSATDGAGRALFDNLSTGRVVARVEAYSFAPVVMAVHLPYGAHAGTRVKLLPLSAPLTFDADAGAVLAPGDARITIPPAALVDGNGDPVVGTVEATFVTYDPAVQGLGSLPGPLTGAPAEGGVNVTIGSMAMAEVTLWQNGNPLKLAPGYFALLELPLSDAASKSAVLGDTVPAWWLDLGTGFWKEDGYGTIQASQAQPGKLAWVAQVSHFTWWNVDKPWTEKNCFDVLVVDPNDMPIPGLPVVAEGNNYIGISEPHVTKANGHACTEIMKGSSADIYVGAPGVPFAPPASVVGGALASSCDGMGGACASLKLTVPMNAICIVGSYLPCSYSGPPGTEGKGLCMAAKNYCNMTGTGWLGCSGEVTPIEENCNTNFDDDCDGLVNEEGDGCICIPGESVACYSGPVNTKDVGVCKGGMRVCSLNGKGGFGPCEGQVIPAPEVCATPGDDDCDGSTACVGKPLWSKSFGGPLAQRPRGVAVDAAGSSFIVGDFEGSADFGSGSVTSAGGTDIFISKRDATGAPLWGKRFGGAEAQTAYGVAVDSAGNVLIVGETFGSLDFGGGVLEGLGGADVIVAKFDSDGNHLWSQVFGDATNQSAFAVAVDSSDSVVFTGSMEGTFNFGGWNLKSAGSADVFVARLDKSGNHQWSQRYGSSLAQVGLSVDVDSNGYILVCGTLMGGSINFGGGALTSAGGGDIFAAKLGPTGAHYWSKRFGDSAQQTACKLTVDSDDNVALTGAFAGTIDFGGGGVLTSAAGDSVFVTKLSKLGAHVWSKQWTQAEKIESHAIAVDGAGSIVVVGDFIGSVDLGGGALMSSGNGASDVFFAKLDGSGGHLWSTRAGDMSAQHASAVTMDSQGSALITGWFAGTLSFSMTKLISAGDQDAFLVKLTP